MTYTQCQHIISKYYIKKVSNRPYAGHFLVHLASTTKHNEPVLDLLAAITTCHDSC